MNLPDSNLLPAPLWLITALHILTLTLHLAAMNFLVGGLVLVLTGRFARRWQNPTVRKVIALAPNIMAATVTLGVAPLLFLQLVFPAQMYSASIISGWFWFLVVPAVILAYTLLYRAAFASIGGAKSQARRLWPALAALAYVSTDPVAFPVTRRSIRILPPSPASAPAASAASAPSFFTTPGGSVVLTA